MIDSPGGVLPGSAVYYFPTHAKPAALPQPANAMKTGRVVQDRVEQTSRRATHAATSRASHGPYVVGACVAPPTLKFNLRDYGRRHLVSSVL